MKRHQRRGEIVLPCRQLPHSPVAQGQEALSSVGRVRADSPLGRSARVVRVCVMIIRGSLCLGPVTRPLCRWSMFSSKHFGELPVSLEVRCPPTLPPSHFTPRHRPTTNEHRSPGKALCKAAQSRCLHHSSVQWQVKKLWSILTWNTFSNRMNGPLRGARRWTVSELACGEAQMPRCTCRMS